ncbi:hypothetical protein Pan216_47660 [Planctomycetes bacterium Pan216]|uniref:Tetratricopeptide repeat protein n=2 Tax=Kolteria novifilia TaxID=2527975 RepID=A0A518BA76_9BACT|nr:hypothetical protein Pan216_47660 [Planctomycetes bacterium Pan216]
MVAWLLASMAMLSGAEEVSATELYLWELERRGLTELLEIYCERGLAAADTPTERRLLLAERLSDSLARRAMTTAETKRRASLWRRSLETIDAELARTDDVRLRRSLQLLRAQRLAQRGRWTSGWRELLPPSEASRAVDDFRESLTLLQQLRPGEANTTSDEDEAPSDGVPDSSLQRLVGNIALSLAEETQETSRDRQMLLRQAVKALSEATSSSGVDMANAEVMLDLARAQRLLGDDATAGRTLATLHEGRSDLASDDRQRLDGERIALLLERGETDEAQRILESEPERDRQPGWMGLQRVALFHAQANRPTSPAEQVESESDAIGVLDRLEQTGPMQAILQARRLFAAQASKVTKRNPPEWRRAARLFERAGRPEQAAEMFARAARERSSDQVTLALDAARNWSEVGQHRKAMELLAETSRRVSEESSASRLLWEAARAANRAYAADPSTERMEAYDRLLGEHRERFPDDRRRHDVTFLLGKLRHAEGDFAEAIELWRSIPKEHGLAKHVPTLILEAYRGSLEPLDATAPMVTRERAATLVNDLEAWVSAGTIGRLPMSAKDRVDAIILRSMILLDPRLDRPREAVELLETLSDDPQGDGESRSRIAPLMLYGKLLQDPRSDVSGDVDKVLAARMPARLEGLRLVNEAALTLPAAERSGVVAIAKRLASGIRTDELDNDQEREARIELVLTEVLSGNREILAKVASVLEDDIGRSPRAQEAVAIAGLGTSHWTAAAEQLRKMASNLRKTSPLWYRSRLGLIESLRKSGQTEEARRLLTVLETLYPDLGGARLRQRFQRERAELGR